MKYRIDIDTFSDQQWNAAARNFSDYIIYQTPAYQMVRAAQDNQQLSRVIIYDSEDQPVLMCHVRIKKLPLTVLKIGYVQWGPLVHEERIMNDDASEMWRLLKDAYVSKKVDVLRIVPSLVDNERSAAIIEKMQAGGFERVRSQPAYHTIYLPVADGPEAIRARFHRSWRRFLGKVEKRDIEIQEGTGSEFFHLLKPIYEQMRQRKGFRGLDIDVFRETHEKLEDCDKMHSVAAFHQGQPLCIHISSYLGRVAEGILTGSTELGLSLNASYLTWWKTLQAAHRAGMEVYNLGGIDPAGNPSVYQYKTRMGGEELYHIGTFDAASNPVKKVLFGGLESVYRLYSKIR